MAIVDGVILVDNTGEDYDLMQDSPTQNWATLNPLSHNYWSPTTYTRCELNLQR